MIIGINGYIGSGKDTVGMILQALTMEGRWKNVPLEYLKAYEGRPNLKGGWEIKKFAGKLKQIASLMTGIPVEKFEDQAFKKTFLGNEWNSFETPEDVLLWAEGAPMTVRTFLQKLGTEAIRDGVHQNAWVNALFADYVEQYNWAHGGKDGVLGLPNWIITDTRFPNEAEAIKARGGIVVRVERSFDDLDLGPVQMRIQRDPSTLHASETGLDDWEFDYVINNNGTLEELLEATKTLLNNLKN